MGGVLRTSTAAGLLIAVALAIGGYAIAARPDITRNGRFLFGDEGLNLFVNSRVLSGARLYEGVFTPYGPLSAWSSVTAARVGGNTAVTYDVLLLVLNTSALVMMFLGLRRLTSPGWALALTVTCAMPAMLAPGGTLGGLTVSPYVALERLIIAGALVLWRPPADRSWRRSLALGLVAGTCMWVRFGTVVLIVGGLVAADLQSWWGSARRDRLLAPIATVLAGVCAMEAAVVLWAWASLPWNVARDVLWPAYFLPSYDWVTPDLRWPTWPPWRMFIGQYAAAAAGIVLGIAALWRSPRSQVAPLVACLIGGYLIGVLGLFRHVHHFRQYAWMLAATAAFVAAAGSARLRMAVLIWSMPVLFVMLRVLAAAPSPGVPVETVSAGTLYLSTAEAGDVNGLNTLAAPIEAGGGRLLAGPFLSGWYAAFDHASPFRHTWLLRSVVRPWEIDAAARAFTGAGAVAVCGSDPAIDAMKLPLALADALVAEFPQSRAISADCRMYGR